MRVGHDDQEQAPERFFKVPKVLASSGLLASMKPCEVKVYMVLCYFANYHSGCCFPNVKTIGEIAGVNKNKIGQATRRLMELGLIIKKRAPRAFKFKNTYTIVRSPLIDPSIIVPQKTDKRSLPKREKDGRWGVVPQNTESRICPSNADSIICPQNTDSKEIELNRNRVSFNSNPCPISRKTIEEIKKLKGEEYIREKLDTGAYVITDDPPVAEAPHEA